MHSLVFSVCCCCNLLCGLLSLEQLLRHVIVILQLFNERTYGRQADHYEQNWKDVPSRDSTYYFDHYFDIISILSCKTFRTYFNMIFRPECGIIHENSMTELEGLKNRCKAPNVLKDLNENDAGDFFRNVKQQSEQRLLPRSCSS
jgi:hypothetical protein